MTPDDENYDAKRIDGLLASYGKLEREAGEAATRLGGHDREFRELRDMRREDIVTMTAALKELDAACAARVGAVRDDLAELKASMKEEAARKERLQLTSMQRVGLAIAATGPVLAAIGMVLQ